MTASSGRTALQASILLAWAIASFDAGAFVSAGVATSAVGAELGAEAASTTGAATSVAVGASATGAVASAVVVTPASSAEVSVVLVSSSAAYTGAKFTVAKLVAKAKAQAIDLYFRLFKRKPPKFQQICYPENPVTFFY